jgi:hypothetical protein
VKDMVSFDQEKMLKPAIIGGIISTVLDIVCCLGIIVGGAIAAHLYVNAGGICDYENCGLVGAISGVIGGLFGSILSYLLMAQFVAMFAGYYPYGMGASLIVSVISGIIFGAILGAVGGVIYVVIKNR